MPDALLVGRTWHACGGRGPTRARAASRPPPGRRRGRACRAGRAATSPTVRRPRPSSTSSVLPPTPQSALIGRGWRKAERLGRAGRPAARRAWRRWTRAWRRTWSTRPRCCSAARSRRARGDAARSRSATGDPMSRIAPVTSRNASSMPRRSTSGVTSSNIDMTTRRPVLVLLEVRLEHDRLGAPAERDRHRHGRVDAELACLVGGGRDDGPVGAVADDDRLARAARGGRAARPRRRRRPCRRGGCGRSTVVGGHRRDHVARCRPVCSPVHPHTGRRHRRGRSDGGASARRRGRSSAAPVRRGPPARAAVRRSSRAPSRCSTGGTARRARRAAGGRARTRSGTRRLPRRSRPGRRRRGPSR